MTYNSYDSYDTTAQYDTSWGEIASPAGSGAMLTSGESFMGTYEDDHIDEYDMEIEQEDEEALIENKVSTKIVTLLKHTRILCQVEALLWGVHIISKSLPSVDTSLHLMFHLSLTVLI